ncbi:MAG: hypothetical protein EHM61_24325 [Acidobacteria bacterium]|nr:MAG: hypothetical protein EHM61_24325 [Acidobacteriota bacterium]
MLQMYQFDDLQRACQVLFGQDLVIDQQFLLGLDNAHLKQAYRKQALATHPDRFAGRGDAVQARNAHLFRQVNEAYQKLSRHLAVRSDRYRNHAIFAGPDLRPPRKKRETVWSPPGSKAGESSIYSPEKVPRWPLRTGEYLYFSGVVNWKTLISALVWQRRQREALGEIARRWGWLSEAEVLSLLRERKRGERLGEILLRRGLVNDFQLGMLLRHQEKNQRPLGRYFVEHNLFSELKLIRYLEDLKRHNSKWDQHPQ